MEDPKYASAKAVAALCRGDMTVDDAATLLAGLAGVSMTRQKIAVRLRQLLSGDDTQIGVLTTIGLAPGG